MKKIYICENFVIYNKKLIKQKAQIVEGEMNWEELEVDALDCVLSRWIAKEKSK